MYKNQQEHKLKKAIKIPVLEYGKILKKRNINKLSLENLVINIESQNKIKMKKVDKNTYRYNYTLFIFKSFSREHMGSGEYNADEKFRSRYTKKEVLKWRKYYETYGSRIIFVSYYYTLDKIITVFSDITTVIFTKKSKIKSDSRISNIKIDELKKIYDSTKKYEIIEKKINEKFLIGSKSNNFLDVIRLFESGEVELPTHKKNDELDEDIETIWLKSSFGLIKSYINNNDMNKFTGELGEFIIFLRLVRKFAKKIIWQSKINSRSKFDMSYMDNKYYEVKSTRENNKLINISESEKSFAFSHLKDYIIMRVGLKDFIKDVDINLIDKFEDLEKIVDCWIKKGSILIDEIDGEKLKRKEFIPSSYRVKLD